MEQSHSLLGRVYLAQLQPQSALEEMRKEQHPVLRLHGLALAYYALARTREADAALAELIDKYQSEAPYQIAEVYGFRGEADRAFQWLEKCLELRDPGISDIKGDPLLKGLRRDPRYSALLKKLRLPLY